MAKKSFRIVGVGASAGGLEALTEFVKGIPCDIGMAFVVVVHLEPKHASLMADILLRHTELSIVQATDRIQVEKNHIYVIPPNANLAISQNKLYITQRDKKFTIKHLPINNFLVSLAKAAKNNSIGVILSGTGSDGTDGIKAVKAAGGLTFAQNEATAKYFSMPNSSIKTGMVDFVLSPPAIAKKLVEISKNPAKTYGQKSALDVSENPPVRLDGIFDLLSINTGVDFTHYRKTTILRRINLRMSFNNLKSYGAYYNFLKNNLSELGALYNNLLISVTSFFRDPASFAALRIKVLPAVIKNKSGSEAIRIWVPGCSAGQEAYSIAITVFDYLEQAGRKAAVQVFGTDLNEANINKARLGEYPKNSVKGVPRYYLDKYFTKTRAGNYRINKNIRDMCIFAKHNVIKDPPLSKMDIISFRNVAIYMDSTLQKKVFGMLGYSLKQSGFLILSSSESLSAYNEMFRIVDSKHKIYAKASHNMRITPHFETPFINQESAKRNLKMKKPIKGRSDGEQEVGDAALPKSREVGRLLKEAMDILQIRGETDPSKKSLRSMIQEKDNANEKLKSALEEVQSSNEELQSMNEEIETAKEELESSNEELTALNDELQERNVELKETQKKLEASGNFNHNIVETINESILVLDRRLRIVSANKHFYKEFKAEASKIENKLIYRIMGNSWNIPELRELLEKILPKKSHFENFEITQKFPKIGIKVVRLNARRIYDHDKKSDLILLAMLDISRIKELEMSNEDAHKKVESILNRDNETLERIVRERTAELLKTRLELEKAKRLSDIGTLASTVAHELRNPLAAIRVALFNVKRKTQEESISHSLETIEKKINESAQIINNLLFYARIQKSDHEPVDLFHIISEIVDTTIKRYSRQKVDVSCSLDFLKNTPISADPLQMKEVFNNLLNNSFDAVANMQGKIEIYGKADNNNVTISIKDNGGGIAKDVLEHIYEPFFTTKSKGTGLGLSVVRQIISLHNGDIAFASELNKGTEVTVTLPIK